jgi:hypothetical protein
MEKEIWKDIPGYEGLYQVSNWGQVKSLKFGKERILKACVGKVGYYTVNFGKTKYVHQLVAIAFLNHQPDGIKTQINHIDKNRLNNCVNNLEIIGHSEHVIKDTFGHGVGASWFKRDSKWASAITKNYKQIHLGFFDDKQDAIDMYQKAVANIHLYNGDSKAFRLALATVSL